MRYHVICAISNGKPSFIYVDPDAPVRIPGGCHEGTAVEKRVATLGSMRCPVASAPAPGAVGTGDVPTEHGTTEMSVFARFYKGYTVQKVHCKISLIPTVFASSLEKW